MKNLPNFHLYLVLDGIVISNEKNLLHIAEVALQNGVTCVQLCGNPEWQKKTWLEVAWSLKSICQSAKTPLIIKEHLDIALAINADGIHLSPDDLPSDLVRRLIGDDKIIGFSAHSLDDVRGVQIEMIDYITVGPVFPSLTQKKPAIGLANLREIITCKSLPIVATGGINAEFAPLLRKMNVDGIAVTSAICNKRSIPAAVRALL